MLPASPLLVQHLPDFFDAHGALLAEFDFYPDQQLMHVRWHGHLTAAAVVAGTRAGIALRQHGAAPRRLLDDKSLASGDWTEALPWLQYEWLPLALAAGLSAVAYVLSPDPTTKTSTLSFTEAVRPLVPLGIFQEAGDAHHWLRRHG